jgi:hypothetical protein
MPSPLPFSSAARAGLTETEPSSLAVTEALGYVAASGEGEQLECQNLSRGTPCNLSGSQWFCLPDNLVLVESIRSVGRNADSGRRILDTVPPSEFLKVR